MDELTAVVSAPAFVEVRRRLFRQLIESLIYERILVPEIDEEDYCFVTPEVTYVCSARRKLSFDRIRLEHDPVMRVTAEGGAEAESLATFLIETQSLHQAPPDLLARFLGEIDQTLLKDAQVQQFVQQRQLKLRELPYDRIESALPDGHPYHPGYKSRVGFDLVDNRNFGPEFEPEVRPVWLAVHRDFTAEGGDPSFLERELGDTLALWRSQLEAPDSYVFMPVHPWQWREHVAARFFEDVRAKRIVVLEESPFAYTPQQSIRTMANHDHPEFSYIKLSMNLVNTSTSRILARHTVLNAPVISRWLAEIVAGDPFLRELGTVCLRETRGVSFDRPLPAPLHTASYGILSCIWRESLHPVLAAGESAAPWSALTHLEVDGQPFVAPWLEEFGLEKWLRQILEISLVPLVHLLCAHGVALESHSQNMILVHRDGWPTRAVFKDFHDGVRYVPELLAEPARAPQLTPTPATHVGVNRNSFVIAERADQVRDFILDAFCFINLAELAMFLERHAGYAEQSFWNLARAVLSAYRAKFQELGPRFELFDVHTPRLQVEKLTNRRLFFESDVQVHWVSNPLA